jgi:hypothetical protein
MSLSMVFPHLAVDGYVETSPATRRYNCIAWAAGHTEAWWCPRTRDRSTMAVTLELPAAIEQQLKERAARLGQTLEEYLRGLALSAIAAPWHDLPGSVLTYPAGFSSPEERSKAIHAWADSHPRVNHSVDDSRESIYAGRGE